MNVIFDFVELLVNYLCGNKFLCKVFYYFFFVDMVVWFEVCGVLLKLYFDGCFFFVVNMLEVVISCFWEVLIKNGVDFFIG